MKCLVLRINSTCMKHCCVLRQKRETRLCCVCLSLLEKLIMDSANSEILYILLYCVVPV